MNLKHQTIALFLLWSMAVMAQFTDEQLYEAYLRNDMNVWGEYVRGANWQDATEQERERILNYEYGYLGYALSAEVKDAEALNQRFAEHINALSDELPEATLLTYQSALSAYNLTLNKSLLLKEGRRTIRFSQDAVAADPKNPFALTMKGNIDFYCPKAFGGNKDRALQYLLQAKEQYEKANETKQWNYQALRLTIAQCYEKTGQKDVAIEQCREILREEPRFQYVSGYYLPHLLGKETADAPQNPSDNLAGKILE